MTRPSAIGVLERGGAPILLVALIIAFALIPSISDVFTSEANFHNLLANQSVTAVIGLAMIVPLVAGNFDLSVSAVAGLANIAMASAISEHGCTVLVALLIALGIALLAGCINGILVAVLRLDALVVTLGTYSLIGGLLSLYTHGSAIVSNLPPSLSEWSADNWLGIPRPFWLLLAVALVCWYVIMHTPFGRKLESIGSNATAARLVGIRVERHVFLSFVLSGVLAGVAGVLLTSSSGSGNPTAGPSYLFAALTAVFIGTTTIRPGTYNVWGTLLGVFLVAIAVNGFTLLGAETWVSQVFNGGALVIAVAVSTLMGRRRESLARAASVRAVASSASRSGTESHYTEEQ